MSNTGIIKTTTSLTVVATIIANLFIMYQEGGLADRTGFGSGQYYYTDIPGWQRLFSGEHYTTSVTTLTLVALFFIWGWLMLKLWRWIDKRVEG